MKTQKRSEACEAKSGIQKDFQEVKDDLRKASHDNTIAIILSVVALGVSMAAFMVGWSTMAS